MSQPYRRGHLRLLTCTSQKLNPAERNYPTHERKMRALVHAIKTWKHYLMGSKVLAYTDNVALRYWKTAQNLSPHHVRGIAYIGMIDMDIAHISGITNTAADAISQLASHALCCPVIGSTPATGKTRTSLTPALAQNISIPLVTLRTQMRTIIAVFGTMTALWCRAATCAHWYSSRTLGSPEDL